MPELYDQDDEDLNRIVINPLEVEQLLEFDIAVGDMYCQAEQMYVDHLIGGSELRALTRIDDSAWDITAAPLD